MTDIPKLISELRTLMERATPGPWDHFYYRPDAPGRTLSLTIPAIGSAVGPREGPHILLNDRAHDEDGDLLVALRNNAALLLSLAEEALVARTDIADQRTSDGSAYRTYGEYSDRYMEARARTDTLAKGEA